MYKGKIIRIVHPGPYRITLEPYGIVGWKRGDIWDGRPFTARAKGSAGFAIGKTSKDKTIDKGDRVCIFENVILPKGRVDFRPRIVVGGKTVVGGGSVGGAQQDPIHVTFERLD